MSTAWLVCMLPDVHQTHGRMESIEHNQWQRQVVQNGPQQVTVELVSEKEVEGRQEKDTLWLNGRFFCQRERERLSTHLSSLVSIVFTENV